MVQQMSSKWADAFMQISAFTNVSLTLGVEPTHLLLWREQIAHWFSLMSAIAVCNLRGDDDGDGVPDLPLKARDITPSDYMPSVEKAKHKAEHHEISTSRHVQ